MPTKTKWSIEGILIPFAHWDLRKEISSARLVLESQFNITVEKDDSQRAMIELISKVTFMSPEEGKDDLGFIEVDCRAFVKSDVDIKEMTQGHPDFDEFVLDISQALFGANRLEISRIGASAGLPLPIILPLTTVTRADFEHPGGGLVAPDPQPAP